jgi:hypothetical protein
VSTDNPTRYEISAPLDFLKVPEDRRSECLREFATWLEIADNMRTLFEGIPMEVARDGAFIWIDDGKSTASVIVNCGDEEIWRFDGKIAP